MKRFTILCVLAFVFGSFASFASTQPPAAQRAKYIPPVKGLATIDVMQMPSRRVGNEMVTKIKVRNTSKGSINLLKADEYWYDRSTKIVSGTQYAHLKGPILPGEVVEIALSSPYNAQMKQNRVLFSHANGKIDPKAVKAFK